MVRQVKRLPFEYRTPRVSCIRMSGIYTFLETMVMHVLCFADNAHVALCYDDGLLWMGNLEEEKVEHLIIVKTEIHNTVGARNPNSNQMPSYYQKF